MQKLVRKQMPANRQDLEEEARTAVCAWWARAGEFGLAICRQYRQSCVDAEVYPIAFIWRSDAWTTIKNILQDALTKRKDEGLLDSAKDFMLDRLDDMLEPVARLLGGKTLWTEMKENATLTSKPAAGQLQDCRIISSRPRKRAKPRRCIWSAIAPARSCWRRSPKYLTDDGKTNIDSLTLWAPACTMNCSTSLHEAHRRRPTSRSSTCSRSTTRRNATTTASTSTTNRSSISSAERSRTMREYPSSVQTEPRCSGWRATSKHESEGILERSIETLVPGAKAWNFWRQPSWRFRQ